MSEYAQYYNAFTADLARGPSGISESDCRCHGGGWILSDVDTWHKCPDHYVAGQRHPDDDFDFEISVATIEYAAPIETAPRHVTEYPDDFDIPF